MFDLTRSYFNDIKEREIAPGASITEEGQCLIYTNLDTTGQMSVSPSGGNSNEIVAGFAITDALKILTEVAVESFTIPVVSPYTAQTKNANITAVGVSPTVNAPYMYDNTTGPPALTYVAGVPGAGQYNITTAGAITFNAAQAGHSVTITYRYNLTAQQTLDKFHARSVNNFAQDYFSTVSVGALEGEIFTSMFDTNQAYSLLTPIYSGASGLLTAAAGGTLIGFVSALPTDSSLATAVNSQVGVSNFLGVKFRLPY